MTKYKTLIVFLALVALWSCFYSILKFFLWGSLETTIKPSLETISGYLSVGGIIAYLIGGAVSSTFLKKYLLSILSFLTCIIVSVGFYVGIESSFVLALMSISVGMTYGLWSVLKNILISMEIVKTGLKDTLVTAVTGISFVVFVIIGTIAGSSLFEIHGGNGVYAILAILIVAGILPFMLDYNKHTLTDLLKRGLKNYYLERQSSFSSSLKSYLPEVVFISKKYFREILVSSFLWAVSTIVSLQVIQFSVATFDKSNSEASMLMMYSAIGVIIGNTLSIKMEEKRWLFFKIFALLLALCIGALPFLGLNYLTICAFAGGIGLFFGIASNLLDASFFRKIGEDNKKEYGSSTYGLLLSITLVISMFLAGFISKQFGFTTLMLILSIGVGGISFVKFSK